jgi:hypothetical protein
MATYLEMLFRNQAGQLVTISVIDPRPDITPGEVEEVMDTIIAQNILHDKCWQCQVICAIICVVDGHGRIL